MIGKVLGHYAIEEKIGAGGMGDVYRARDTRLDRAVALKVLPPDAARDPERRQRFLKEAKAVAALRHPNIVTIHSVDEADGIPFLTMELVEGPTLSEHVGGGGSGAAAESVAGPAELPAAALLDLAVPLADAVGCAHERGIVHRDLKPANIMLDSDGRLKVLDFGLAKLLAPPAAPDDDRTLAGADATQAGAVLGTAAYMSPEQAEGREVDARSDVFALGIILYELAAGTPPFRGASAMATIAAILTEEPPPVAQYRRDLPAKLARIIARCLEKDPQGRYGSAGELHADLSRLRKALRDSAGPGTAAGTALPSATPPAAAAADDRTSIVVLPFANLSPDPDTEYFSDGLTDEIITDLTRVRALRVISRSSAMRLKGSDRDLSAIGRDLSCRYVLEGSVRRAADSLRITARLVDAPVDHQVWADKYGGTLDDVFDIQERVSRSIVDALEIRLSPQEAERLAERPIEDVRAQESYLRARSEIWSFLPGSLDTAINHLEAALRLIGDNALIYQALGEAYFQSVNIGAARGREEEFIARAERCADRIFAREPDSPRGHLVRGCVRMVRGDVPGSARSFRRVLDVFPGEIMALQLYTHAFGWLGGKPEISGPAAARLVDIDPLNAMSLLMSAMVPLFSGRFSEAVEPARRMFGLDPVTPVWRANYVLVLAYAERIDEAEELTRDVAAAPDSDIGTWQMGLTRAAWREDRAEVLRLTDGPFRQLAEWDAEVPWILAAAHSAVGLRDEALDWLDLAVRRGMINHPFLSEHDRFLENIRTTDRFARVMGRARREWDRLEA